jgi:hypothetical protein
MKTHSTIASVLLYVFICFAASSCDEVDKLTEFDVNDTITTTINVSVPDNQGNPITLDDTTEIDLSSIDEIQDNMDLIQSVRVTSISYEITNFDGAAEATISNASMAFGTTNISVSDINLQEADNNNTVFTITDTGDLNAISNALESNSSINLVLTGTINSTPLTFDVIVRVDVTVVVDVI